MSIKREPSPTLSFSDEDEPSEERGEMRRRVMTPAEARNLPESRLFKIINSDVSHDVSYYLLNFVTTLGIMESAAVSKLFVTEMLYSDEFWKRRWIHDFPDHAREIGSQLPSWCIQNNGDGIDIYGEKRPVWDQGGFLPWKKYWIWTWFFRRTLMRIFAELFTMRAKESHVNTSVFLRQPTYTFTLKPRSSNEMIVSRQGSDQVFVLTMRQLVSLSEQYRGNRNLWGNLSLKARLEAAVSNPGPPVSLPLAAMFISNNIINEDQFISVPVGVGRLNAVQRYTTALQTNSLQADRLSRDLLASNYLKWYVFEVLSNNFPLRPDEEPGEREDTDLVKLIKQRMPIIIDRFFEIFDSPGQAKGPPFMWHTELSSLLNAPRISGIITLGDPEADANRGKIFLGQEICSNCGLDAEKRCKQCKSKYYCSKECIRADWKNHKAECTEQANIKE